MRYTKVPYDLLQDIVYALMNSEESNYEHAVDTHGWKSEEVREHIFERCRQMLCEMDSEEAV